MNMASLYCLFFTVLVLLVVTMSEQVDAKEYQVGDTDGWREPGEKNDKFYKQWADKKTFQIGDSLRFPYEHDSVLVVNKWSYYHCNTTKPILFYKDGNTVLKIKKPEPMFFISGDKSHCDKGQRLAIDVGDAHKKNGGEDLVSVKLVTVCLALIATSAALA